MAADTRDRLVAATLDTLRRHGMAGLSARTIAAAAGVNQALIFYHFASVADLVGQACRQGTEARVALYRPRFAEVSTVGELLDLATALHERELAEGNVTILAQALAGAQHDAALREAAAEALDLWRVEIEAALVRALAGNPLADAVEPAQLARAVLAGFVGVELYGGVDADGAAAAMAALQALGVVSAVLDELGPVARRAVRARVRRGSRRVAREGVRRSGE